jgi:hypothetical protein
MSKSPMRCAMTGVEIRDSGDGIWDDGEWISWQWINGQIEEQQSLLKTPRQDRGARRQLFPARSSQACDLTQDPGGVLAGQDHGQQGEAPAREPHLES